MGSSLMSRIRAAPSQSREEEPKAAVQPAPSLSARLGLSAFAVDPSLRINNNSRPGVGPSADLRRIVHLPRRVLDIDNQDAALVMTHELRTFHGKAKLRPIQAVTLRELQRQKDNHVEAYGLLGLIGVGHGKTLISLLAATVLDSKCTVILVPAQLQGQLLKKDIPLWREHFKIRENVIHVISYSKLSRVDGAEILEELKPDLIVADEVQALRDSKAARTKRFKRYMKEHAGTRFVALSGSLTTKSLRDYYHLSSMSLGEDNSPLPVNWPTVVEWSQALDSVKEGREHERIPIGALDQLCDPGETARQGFQRRLRETQGVVVTRNTNEVDAALYLRSRPFIPDFDVLTALQKLRSTWALPGGEELEDILAFTRAARQLACGFYYRWKWPNDEPDHEWLEARKEWHKEIRSYLAHSSRPGMDSPLLLTRAAQSGRWASECWAEWDRVRDRPKPPTEAVWVSDKMVLDAIEWGKKNIGIIWYESTALGELLASMGEFPLYDAGAKTSRAILDETGRRTIVASVRAHGTGKNLQRFSRNLVMEPSSNGGTWEQLLGRTHRPGQEEDEVWVDYYAATPEMEKAIPDARQDAEYIYQSTGQEQRLLQATFLEI